MSLKVNFSGTQLKATKPKSVKALQKYLVKDTRKYDFVAKPYECGISSIYPEPVVAWCVDWINAQGFTASYRPFDAPNADKGWNIMITKEE